MIIFIMRFHPTYENQNYKRMKKYFFLLLFMFALVISASSQALVEEDEERGIKYLVGECSDQDWAKVGFDTYLDDGFAEYQPNETLLDSLKLMQMPDNILIVLATWCHDSQVQVPRFLRVLQDAGYPESSVKVLAVDLKKKAGDLDISELNIERVPTFIFYDDQKEIGRIIEKPVNTLEMDFYQILRNKR